MSAEVLDAYFATPASNPAEILVYCGDEAKWRSYWAACPKIAVTCDQERLRKFLEFKRYDTDQDCFLPVPPPSPSQQIWYPWKRIKGGIVYGGAGTHEYYVDDGGHLYEGGWSQGTGRFPDVPMSPFD